MYVEGSGPRQMTRINQFVKIVNCEDKLKGSLNSSLVMFLQQGTIRNCKKRKKKRVLKNNKLKTTTVMKRK